MLLISNIAQDRYYLNGKDMFTEFGFVATEGSNDILKMYEAKEPYTYSWEDEHGVDIDETVPVYFKPKDINLSGYIVSSNESGFWIKYQKLIDELSATGMHALLCKDLNATVHVRYKSMTGPRKIGRLRGTQGMAFVFTIVFFCNYESNVFPGESDFFFQINGDDFEVGGENVLVN